MHILTYIHTHTYTHIHTITALMGSYPPLHAMVGDAHTHGHTHTHTHTQGHGYGTVPMAGGIASSL